MIPRTGYLVVCVLSIFEMVFAQPEGPGTFRMRVYPFAEQSVLMTNDVVSTADGGALVSAYYGTWADSLSGIYLLRLDYDGALLLHTAVGDCTLITVSTAICRLSSNRLAVIGEHAPLYEDENLYAVLVDDYGFELGRRYYDLPDDQTNPRVCATGDGGFMVSCRSIDRWTYDETILWMKMDDSGDTLWTRRFAIPESEMYPRAIARTLDGGYVIAGDLGEDSPLLLLKIRPDGELGYCHTYQIAADNFGMDVAALTDGSYVICGSAEFWTEPTLQGFVLRVSAAGDSLWSWLSPVEDGDKYGNRVLPLQDGGFVAEFTGSVSSELFRFSAGNEMLWYQVYPLWAPYRKFAIDRALLQDEAGHFLLVGQADNDNPPGYSEVAVVMTYPDPVATGPDHPAYPPQDFGLRVSPNPFNSKARISFELTRAGAVSLRVFDVTGREVATLAEGVREAGRQSLEFDGESLGSGIYVARLSAAGEIRSMKLVLLK